MLGKISLILILSLSNFYLINMHMNDSTATATENITTINFGTDYETTAAENNGTDYETTAAENNGTDYETTAAENNGTDYEITRAENNITTTGPFHVNKTTNFGTTTNSVVVTPVSITYENYGSIINTYNHNESNKTEYIDKCFILAKSDPNFTPTQTDCIELKTLENYIAYKKKKDLETKELINQINQNTQMKLKELEKKYSINLTVKKPLTYIVIIVVIIMCSSIILLDAIKLKNFITRLIQNRKPKKNCNNGSKNQPQNVDYTNREKIISIEKNFNRQYKIYLNNALNKRISPYSYSDSNINLLFNKRSFDVKNKTFINLNDINNTPRPQSHV